MQKQEKQILLQLARQAIHSKLFNKKLAVDHKLLTEILKQKQGVFVSLTLAGQLRGCMGHLLATQPLYWEVIDNAKAAAFLDPRFEPLTKEELTRVKIEISVLSKLELFPYQTITELLNYLVINKPGVVISQGLKMATFLPQVWEELPTAEEFLTQLCLKANLTADSWQRGIEIKIYSVEKFSDNA